MLMPLLKSSFGKGSSIDLKRNLFLFHTLSNNQCCFIKHTFIFTSFIDYSWVIITHERVFCLIKFYCQTISNNVSKSAQEINDRCIEVKRGRFFLNLFMISHISILGLMSLRMLGLCVYEFYCTECVLHTLGFLIVHTYKVFFFLF